MNRQMKEKITRRAQFLKREYAEVRELLSKKRSEIEGLAKGIEKHKDDPAYLSQIEALAKNKVREVKGLNERLKKLRRICRQGRNEISELSRAVEASRREAQKPVRIATSKTTEKVLDKILTSSAEKPQKTAPEKAKKAAEKPEIKIKSKLKKAKHSPDLYDKAASEAKAQEAYFKAQKSKIYGDM